MTEPTVVVGLLIKVHGLGGEVVVENRSDNPDRWRPGSVVSAHGRALRVVRVRRHGPRLLVKFEGIADRSAAEQLPRGEITVPISELPELGRGEYWPHEVIGCEVVTQSGGRVGRITDVVANPANDLWVALDDAGHQTMVPAVQDLVLSVDVTAKRVVVRDMPGLTGR
jgi:16S rRNA processing protein RimM